VCCGSATLVQLWSHKNFGKEAPTRKSIKIGTSRLLKQVAFVLRRIIRADDQVARLWNAFVRRFSVVRRNPQGGQAGNWVMSLT
jgi:hypothetical protein